MSTPILPLSSTFSPSPSSNLLQFPKLRCPIGNPILSPRRRRSIGPGSANCDADDISGGGGDGDGQGDGTSPPRDALGVRFRRGSRKRLRREQQQNREGSSAVRASMPPPRPKGWGQMSFKEKAMELYVGERGLLFWLNKLAYASIFVVIGGWVLFRFVGPALNLYQLDSPPLSPSSIFKG